MHRALFIFGTALSLAVPALAVAHGFGQRIDLPVPLYLYLFGGGAIVALSFILLGLVPRRFSESLHAYPKYDLTRFAWFRAITSKTVLLSLRLLFVVVLVVSVGSGFFGDQNPAFNVLPTVVWILFAIGVTFTSALIGNIWSVVNPFATLYGYAENLFQKFSIARGPVRMPAVWGVWPAVILFFGFRWIENASSLSSDPRSLALFILVYTAITFYGMATYGRELWLKRGDPFSVFFSFLSRFSILEAGEDKKIYVRPLGVGLLNHSSVTISEVAFVLLMLSSVAADGMLGTPFFLDIARSLLGVGVPWLMVGTIGLLGLFGTFCAAYYGFSYLTKVFSSDASSILDVAKRFIFSLLPIAIAYEIAHYVSILVIEGQRALYLISDPFGKGWNLFGTASYEINYSVLNLKTLWDVQVALIVIGHVVAVIIAHAVAERYFKDSRKALISQYPMLLLMIFYSCLSLWIMAQPIVAVD